MDAATLATQIVGMSLVSAVITEFTKDHVSASKPARTVWALVVSASIALIGVVLYGLFTWVSSGELSWRSLFTAIVVQIPAVIGGAQAIYGAVQAIVPGSGDVNVSAAVKAVKTLATTVEKLGEKPEATKVTADSAQASAVSAQVTAQKALDVATGTDPSEKPLV